MKSLEKLEENVKSYVAKFKHFKSVRFEACGGRKYIKVKSFETRVETDYETGEKTILKDKKGRIHCFVEKETGDVYKPQTWRAPYTKGKNAVRANIYDLTTVPDNANQCGGWLYVI